MISNEEDPTSEVVHTEHLLNEVVFQHLIRFKDFENIPVGKLKRHASTISGTIRNVLYAYEKGPKDYKRITDANANDEYYWRAMAIAGVEAQKREKINE